MRFRVSVDNLPFISLLLGVSVEDTVGDDVDRVGILFGEEVGQYRSDGGHHSAVSSADHFVVTNDMSLLCRVMGGIRRYDIPGDNDDGNSVLLAPEVKVLESTVETNV
jgi:hypothetical protein